ncbi:putative developmentally regulated GTP-binding protein 1, partial [Gregarina niphandrodes]
IEGGSKGGGGGGEGFDVTKTGDARIGLIGFPSVGKSTLLTKLTGQYSEQGEYEFTTLTCVPGVLKYKGAKLQLLDLPGIIEGAKDGKGRGKQVIAVARTCSLILIVLDAMKPLHHKRLIEKELEGFGIRLNKRPPNITITRKDKGGIIISRTQSAQTGSGPGAKGPALCDEMVKMICSEYNILNGSVVIRGEHTVDDLIDAIEGNCVYIPCIYVMNKVDECTVEELDILARYDHYCMISARHGWNLDELVEKIWEYLDLIRIYTKTKGQAAPDYAQPIILRRIKATIKDLCLKIHKQLLIHFKCALVWGNSVKHNPQKVGKDHTLQDEDIVQIIKQ